MTPLRFLIAAVTTAFIFIALFACQNSGSGSSHPPPALNIAVLSPTVPLADLITPPTTPSPPATNTPGASLLRLTQTIDVGKELEAAHLHRRNGDYSHAISQYQYVISVLPDSPEAKEARYWLGRTYLLSDQYELAAQTFRACLQNYPDDERSDQIVFLLATSERESGHWQKAIEYYQVYASKKSVIQDYVNLQMANIYVEVKDYTSAIALYETALSDDKPAWLQSRAMGRIAESCLGLNDYEKALYYYSELLKKTTIRVDQASILYQIGTISQEVDKSEEAKDAFLKVVVSYPSTAVASSALDTLLRLDPNAVNYCQQGMVYYYSRRNEEALSAFQRYLEFSPQGQDTAKAHYYAGLTYWRIDDNEKALAQWGKLIGLYPQDDLADDALWERATLLESLSRYGEATREYRALEEQHPFSEYRESAVFRQGLCYFKQRDYESAKSIWTKQAENPSWLQTNTRTFLWLGKLHLLTGESEKAKAYFEKAQAAEPRDYYALRANALYSGDRDFSSSATTLNTALLLNKEKLEREELEGWLSGWAWHEPYSFKLDELSLPIVENPYYQRGKELFAVGLRDDAILEFRQLVWRFWSDPVTLSQLSLFFRDQNLYQLSILCADRVLSLSHASFQEAPAFLQKLIYPSYFADLVTAETAKRGIDPLLFLCLIRQESMFDHYAISSAQARGLTQVIPATGHYIAESLGRVNFQNQDLYKPYLSIEFGVWYLAAQLKYFDSDALLALAAYNAGPGNVDSWLGNDTKYDIDLFVEDIPFSETQTYVKKLYQYYEQYKAIYDTHSNAP